MSKSSLNLLFFLVLIFSPIGSRAAAQSAFAPGRASPRLGSVIFVENAGQWDPTARFQVWGGSSGTVWLAEDALWVTLVAPSSDEAATQAAKSAARFDLRPREGKSRRGATLRVSFLNGNEHARLEPFGRLDTAVSFFTGNGPSSWHSGVPVWTGVRYLDLYPGIDLEITSANGRLVQRLLARPDADLASVALQVVGASDVTIDGDVLRLGTVAGDISLPLLGWVGQGVARPSVLPRGDQMFEVISPISARAASAAGERQGFSRSRAIEETASPADSPGDLLYGTFVGGSSGENGADMVLDAAGCAYVAGKGSSANFPTTPGAFDVANNGDDAFVVKLSSDFSALVYATFLGGSASDEAAGIALDSADNAYVTGGTQSSDFPVTQGSFDTSANGSADVFVAKLSPTGGALLYATLLGGSDWESSAGIAVDAAGAAYVAGQTQSSDFPVTPGALDTVYDSYGTAYAVKLNPSGSGLDYSTFVGGSIFESATSIAVDAAGSAFVSGRTVSGDFPTTPGAFDTTFAGGDGDTFLAKLNSTGSGLVYGTYLGGGSEEYQAHVALDAAGNAYVTGYTYSADFPTTAGAFDPHLDGTAGGSVYVVKLDADGARLDYGTYLDGANDDGGTRITVDASGCAFVTGWTCSSDFPTTPGAFDTSYSGDCDGFAVMLNPVGSGLAYATFLGGVYGDRGNGIAVDSAGDAFVSGGTSSNDFPTTAGAFDTSQNGGEDVFVVKLATSNAPTYTVEGRVTDNDGNGIAGVVVSAGAAGSATTGGDGSYTLSGLFAGSYTLTATETGRTFYPASRTASVPPSATGMNFSTDLCTSVSEVPQSECRSLVALYNSTNGPGWTSSTGWLASDTPCSWAGVTCSAGHVTALYMDFNQLNGNIPPQLSNLTELVTLSMFYNQLSGTIPPELGDLTSLQGLNLGENRLSGVIPQTLSKLTALKWLELPYNSLTGMIPHELGDLPNLQEIWLSVTQLSGPVPPELGSLSTLKYLYLENTLLSGALPQSLKALALADFRFSLTTLCEPPDYPFQSWLDGIGYVESTEVQCSAQPVTVGIAVDGSDVVLQWTHLDPNTAYEVHRYTAPFFSLTDATRITTLAAPAASYRDEDAAHHLSENYFYALKSRFVDSANDLSATSTNEAGQFSFALVGGQ